MKSQPLKGLTQLGGRASLPQSPDKAVIEKIKNPHKGVLYSVRLNCPEFTSICPITGQPDFAHLIIDYIPKDWIIESKSLKLFLGSFRNHGAFHEDCTVAIALRLVRELKPVWLKIGGYWFPRGGIPIDIFYQTGKAPEEAQPPAQNIPLYRGR